MPNGVSYYLGPPGPSGYSDDPSYRNRHASHDGWWGPADPTRDISDFDWEDAGYSIVDTGYTLPREDTRELVYSLHSMGASYSRINRLTGVSRRTIKRWIEYDDHESA